MTAALAIVPPATAQHLRPQFICIPGAPNREYYAFLPETLRPEAEPLVLVHGISRNAAELVMRFADLANRFGVPLIAPLFRRESYGQYQQAIDARSGLRSDNALCDILTDASQRFGISTDRVALFGFSGGAQFAHRFSLIHPGRVRACVPASAGWYTMPDPDLAWPLGLAGLPGGKFDPAVLTIPFHLVIGQRDTQADDALRRNPELDQLQGTNRRLRAKAWHRALRRAGWSKGGSLTVLPRTRHNFACADRNGLTQTVFRLLGYEGPEE